MRSPCLVCVKHKTKFPECLNNCNEIYEFQALVFLHCTDESYSSYMDEDPQVIRTRR